MPVAREQAKNSAPGGSEPRYLLRDRDSIMEASFENGFAQLAWRKSGRRRGALGKILSANA